MKRIMLIAALMLFAGGAQAYGQSFKELLSNGGVKDMVESVVRGEPA